MENDVRFAIFLPPKNYSIEEAILSLDNQVRDLAILWGCPAPFSLYFGELNDRPEELKGLYIAVWHFSRFRCTDPQFARANCLCIVLTEAGLKEGYVLAMEHKPGECPRKEYETDEG